MKKLKIGIIGVGRLGYEHACNIANRVPGSELVAIADTRSGMGFTIMETFTDKMRVRSTPGKGTLVAMVKVLKERQA